MLLGRLGLLGCLDGCVQLHMARRKAIGQRQTLVHDEGFIGCDGQMLSCCGSESSDADSLRLLEQLFPEEAIARKITKHAAITDDETSIVLFIAVLVSRTLVTQSRSPLFDFVAVLAALQTAPGTVYVRTAD